MANKNKLKYILPAGLGIVAGAYAIGTKLTDFVLSPNSSSSKRKINEDDAISLTKSAREQIIENYEKDLAIGKEFEKDCDSSTINSKDGLILRAKYRLRENSKAWVILVHGYKTNNTQMMPFAKKYYDKGYNVLMPDNRAHGESDGSYIGMGFLDKEDLSAWIDWILLRDIDAKIIMHGISMGAAAIMMLGGDRPKNVVGYIEDCGYTDVYSILESEFKKRAPKNLPTKAFMELSNFTSKINAGYSYSEASAIDQVKRIDKPILFIHGAKDDFVPVKMAYQLYYAAKSKKDFYLVPEAGHAQVKDYDPKAYWDRVFSFIDKNMAIDGDYNG